jgi:hypothetical protein
MGIIMDTIVPTVTPSVIQPIIGAISALKKSLATTAALILIFFTMITN